MNRYDGSITVTRERDDDGTERSVLQGEWPDGVRIDGDLRRDHDERWMQWDDEKVTITLSNASAVYRIDRYDEPMDRYECSRVVSVPA